MHHMTNWICVFISAQISIDEHFDESRARFVKANMKELCKILLIFGVFYGGQVSYFFTKILCVLQSMADPEFSRLGAPPPEVLARYLPKTTWKWKKLDRERGGHSYAHLGSYNGKYWCCHWTRVMVISFNVNVTLRSNRSNKEMSALWVLVVIMECSHWPTLTQTPTPTLTKWVCNPFASASVSVSASLNSSAYYNWTYFLSVSVSVSGSVNTL